jgi:hypothetical protein
MPDGTSIRRVLVVAYVFPPAGGAGVQRVTKFVKYLPEFGWDCSVLTVANPSVPVFNETLARDVPESTVVRLAKTLEPGYALKNAVSSGSGGSRTAKQTGGFKKMLKSAEAQFRSVPGANGALYAMRREAFRPIPDSTLLDDVVIPMVAVMQGWRCVFERKAIAWDDPSDSLGREAIRKRRTIAGAAQLVVHHPSWLLPWKNPIWLEFVSHKMLRLVSPVLLLSVAVTNVLLVSQLPYSLLLLGQICFYYSAFAGLLCQKIGRPSSIFGIQAMFVTLNATTVAALFDAIRGRFRVTWQRT